LEGTQEFADADHSEDSENSDTTETLVGAMEGRSSHNKLSD